jgi:hypothetical protein
VIPPEASGEFVARMEDVLDFTPGGVKNRI